MTRRQFADYPERPSSIAWRYGRSDWLHSLHRHPPSRRDVNELGSRATLALWAEEESPLFWITQRAKQATR